MNIAKNITACTISPELLRKRFLKGTMCMIDGQLHKYCPDCKEFWPADSEFFYVAKTSKDGLFFNCKACYIEKRWPNGRNGLSAMQEPDYDIDEESDDPYCTCNDQPSLEEYETNQCDCCGKPLE